MRRPFQVSDSRKRAQRAGAGTRAEARAERLVARILEADATYGRKVAAVRRAQKRLEGRLSAEDWQLYLELEEAEIGRWSHALSKVAKWALGSRRKGGKR